MNLEEQLRTAFHAADGYEPSPDLFARVQRTLDEDRAHRRRVRRGSLLGAAGVVALVVWFAVTATVTTTPGAPGWALEVATTVVLVTVVLALAPLLRRFGRPYVGEVMGSADGARRFAALLETAMFLLCSGYVLSTAQIGPELSATIDAGALGEAVSRVAGLLLLLGVLHTVTILTLPVIRLVLADTRWREAVGRERRARLAADPWLRRADRISAAFSVVVAAVPVGALVVALLVLITLGLR